MFNLNLASLFSVSCAFSANHYGVMVFMTVGPITVCALIGLYYYYLYRYKGIADSNMRGQELLARCFKLVLPFTFLVFPGSSTSILVTFMQDSQFDHGKCYLREDYLILCNTVRYRWWVYGYAAPMILIYPIGVSSRCQEREIAPMCDMIACPAPDPPLICRSPLE